MREDCPPSMVPARASTFALARMTVALLRRREPRRTQNDLLAMVFVHSFLLASGWVLVGEPNQIVEDDEDVLLPPWLSSKSDDISSESSATYRFDFDDRKLSTLVDVRSTRVGKHSLSFTFAFETERDIEEKEEEEEDEIKTLLVTVPQKEAGPKGYLLDEECFKDQSVRKLGEDIVNQMVKEKILNHRGMVEPAKEKECLKCKEWERLDLERRRLQEQQRQNEILGGGYPDRNDPFSSRGPPSFPRQPLHPGMGPRIDYIGPPDIPDFGRNF